MTKTELIEKLRSELPVMWERTKTDMLTGGVCRARTLANLQTLGEGPDGIFRSGRKIIITREPFLEWLSGRISDHA